MKRRSTLLACTAFLALTALTCAPSAQAGEARGAYVGIAAGWNSQENIRADLSGSQYLRKELSTDDNALLVFSGGYRFDNHWRLEGEINYTNHGMGKGEFSGHTSTLGGMINALYEFDVAPRLSLALGAGIGMGAGTVKITGNGSSTSTSNRIHDTRTAPQWQLIGEANYTLTPHLELFANYRYRGLQLDNDTYATRYYTTSGYDTVGKLHSWHDHTVLFGIRFFFNGPAKPAAPVAAAPPPPPPAAVPTPPPPPPVTTYVVFFDFASADLTDTSKQIVAQAVKTAKTNGFVRVRIVGHTDTTGSAQLNQDLSEKRAEIVKAQMAELGLDATGIAVEGKGFHDLLVPTGKNVKEPQNRRAVIDLGQ